MRNGVSRYGWFILVFLFAANAAAQNKVVVVPLGGSDAKNTSVRTTKNYPGGLFYSAFNNQGYFRNVGQFISFENNSQTAVLGLSVDLDLPQGAELQSLTCYIDDQEASYDFGFASSAEINRRPRNSVTDEDVLTTDLILTTSGDSGGLTQYSTSSFMHNTIDNEAYFYTMYVFFQMATSGGGFVSTPFTASNIRFYGCTIEYDIDTVTIM